MRGGSDSPDFLSSSRWRSGAMVGAIGRWSHLFGSLNSFFFVKTASIFPNYTHFFHTETSVLDRHAEERLFVLLVVGSEGVLVEQHQFGVIRAGFREFGKFPSDGGDQIRLSLHSFVVRHRATRIADSEWG
jgi:hypothetical protein